MGNDETKGGILMGLNMPKITRPFSGVLVDNTMKKQLEEKEKERSKIYGFIGMDVYDLYQQGKLDLPELEAHFEKMKELEQEIAELEAEKQRREQQSKKGGVCSCGQVLSAKDSFCPNCGKPVGNGMITCVCGKQIKSDLRFCPNCGKNVKEILENGGNAGAQTRYRECICGAKVPEGQFMCMECGRKVE